MFEAPTTSPLSLSQFARRRASPQSAQVLHVSLIPTERMARLVAGQVRESRDLTAVVQRVATPNAPPRVPRSTMWPFSQRNGATVGSPVVGFRTESVADTPATWPRAFTSSAKETVPSPSVPRSWIAPFCHRAACHWVGEGVGGPTASPRLSGSGIVLVAPPTS